jgi:hypothetical protein
MRSFSDSHYWFSGNQNASETAVSAGMDNTGFNCLDEQHSGTDDEHELLLAA